MSNTLMEFNYDSKYDILNYKISSTANSYGDEDKDGIVYLRDIDTDVITGFTIFNFMKTYNQNKNYFAELSKYFNIDDAYSECKKNYD